MNWGRLILMMAAALMLAILMVVLMWALLMALPWVVGGPYY